MAAANLVAEIEARWRRLFERLAAGGDAPPGQRLRIEGLMEAAVLCGLASEESLQDAMDAVHRAVFGVTIAACSGEEWRTLFPFPEIPVFARRAPVYPGSGD